MDGVIENSCDINISEKLNLLNQDECILTEKLQVLENEIKKDKIGLSKTEENLKKIIKDLLSERFTLEERIEYFNNESEKLKAELEPSLSQYKKEERYYLYFIVLQHIDGLSSNIKASLVIKSYEDGLKFLLELAGVWNRITLGKTAYSNLLAYLADTLSHWYGIVFQKLLGDFEESAAPFGWPMVSSEVIKSTKSKDKETLNNYQAMQQLDLSIQLILRLPEPTWLSKDVNKEAESSKISSDPISPLSTRNDIFYVDGIDHVSPLTQICLVPFYKRFQYHFTGIRKTNKNNKPEWYFSQLLEWIKLNSPFLYTVLQPILEKYGSNLDIQADFIKGSIYIAKQKLARDLASLPPEDEDTFTHIIDETVVFHRGLSLYGYELSVPSCLEIFCENRYFARWIAAEHSSATEKVNEFLLSPNAWVCDYIDKAGAKEKVPEFVEKYLILLEYLSDRYDFIPFPLKKIQFSAIQIELLDDFRVRLLQILRDKKLDQCTYTEIKENLESYCYILNSFDFIIKTLNKWKDMPTFVHIGYIKSKYSKFVTQKRRHNSTSPDSLAPLVGTLALSEKPALNMGKDLESVIAFLDSALTKLNSPTAAGRVDPIITGSGNKADLGEEEREFYDTILTENCGGRIDPCLVGMEELELDLFADTIELYWMARADTLNHLIDCAKALCHLKLRPYKNQRWHTLPPKTYFISMELSPLACDILSFMKELLFLLKKYLTGDIFKKFMVKLTKDLDNYMFEEVIIKNHFNDGGAHQLNYDMTKGFLSILSLHTTIPENLFKKSMDASLILNLNRGTALLLKESLADTVITTAGTSIATDIANVRKQKEALTDLGIRVLDVDQVLEIISLRKYGSLPR